MNDHQQTPKTPARLINAWILTLDPPAGFTPLAYAAELLGCSKAHVCNLKAGRNRVSPDLAARLEAIDPTRFDRLSLIYADRR